ncbi:LysE family translocator [Owenweeksia hongkongensis]|uniref:LysE family translocator n=1 Tax=Owenweeksia hongkongensis TaxID=253245 RepID=UPI003A90B781
MLEVILYAVTLGITLSFAAGPVFFVIIETSISQGKTKALMLDLGAALADVIFILIAFYGSQSLISSLEDNIWVSLIGGLAVVVFGGYYILKSKTPGQFKNRVAVKRKRLFFFKGFLLNFLNVGVLFYWIATTVAIGSLVHHERSKMIMVYALIMLTYLTVDMFKIYFANKFKERFKGRNLQMVEKIIGLILLLFGIYIVIRAFL